MKVYLLPLGVVSPKVAEPLLKAGKAWSLGDGRGFTLAQIHRRGESPALITPDDKIDQPTKQALERFAVRRGEGEKKIRVMGIINATPDSFSDGGDNLNPNRAVATAEKMLKEGANLLDIGGESTRPGASSVSQTEELERIMPVVESLAGRGAKVSVDTQKAEVMKRATAAGATVINDISALEGEGALEVAAESGAEVILMHKRGTPETMREKTDYRDLTAEVYDYLEGRIAACEAAGIPKIRIMIDVGIGFAKTAEQNARLLAAMPMFYGLGCPLVLGVSRKRFISALSREDAPKQRLGGSLAAVFAANPGAGDIVRTHDVAATRQALDVFQGIFA